MEPLVNNTTLIEVPKTADVHCEPTSQQTVIVNQHDLGNICYQGTNKSVFMV